MIGLNNITCCSKTNRKLFHMFLNVMKNYKEKKYKKPKGKAEEGSYCPKIKPGQSWSYTKDRIEKEDDREDVA